MPDTTRRVTVMLTIPIQADDEPSDVPHSVQTAVQDGSRFGVESASVHTLDDAHDDEPTVCLVLTPDSIRWCDTEAADVISRGVHGVTVELLIVADHRGEEPADA